MSRSSCACVSYIISGAVCPLVSERRQDEAEVLLGAGQRLVVEAVVALLVAQDEGGGQGRQLGGDVRLGGVRVTPEPQDGAFACFEQLVDDNRERDGQQGVTERPSSNSELQLLAKKVKSILL